MSADVSAPVLPDTSDWVQAPAGKFIDEGTPFIVYAPNGRSNFKITPDDEVVVLTPPPAPVPVWSVLSTDREKPTLARVTWREGCYPNVTRGEYWRDERYVLDVYGERVGSLDEDVVSVTLLHTLDPSTHVPVERALINEAADWVSDVMGGPRRAADITRALAALARGAKSKGAES